MNLANSDISEITIAVPQGHRHLRTLIRLQNGEEIILQEATVANLVRAYMTLKTHPQKRSIIMRGVHLNEKKHGFADWQLLEEES